MTGEQLAPVVPEIFVALAAMALLMIGVFRGDSGTRSIAWLTVAGLAAAFVLVLAAPSDGKPILTDMFISDPFAVFVKCLILIGSAVAVIMSLGYIHREGMARFELPILMLLATLGMMMMVSASNLISLYIGLELQSLALYVVAAIHRDSLRSTEAGLKYFVLGALSSGMLLYGCSLIYGFTGTTSFAGLSQVLIADTAAHPPIGFLVGLVFLLAGLAFKVSGGAVPHVDARCLRRRTDSDHRVFCGRAQDRGDGAVLACHDYAVPGDRLGMAADRCVHFRRLDAVGRFCGDQPDQCQTPDGLQFDRPYGLRPGRPGGGHDRGRTWRIGLSGDLSRDECGCFCLHPVHADQRGHGRENR